MQQGNAIMEITNTDIKKAIIRAQHCQRNWDLSKEIPEDDIQLIIDAATQCPSKQNSAFYNVYAITDRNIIEKIHEHTSGFYIIPKEQTVTNSQTLANLLLVFTAMDKKSKRVEEKIEKYGDNEAVVTRDTHMAVGVAAGFVNVTASLKGYNTGCCACYDSGALKEILDIKEEPLLLMGVGFKSDKNRLVHHKDDSIVFPAIKKEPIKVTRIQ